MPIVIAAILSLRSLLRTRAALQLEILALRHQLQVLERSRQPRLRLTTADRLLWVSFSRIWSEWRSALVLVQPATVIGWHRPVSAAGCYCDEASRVHKWGLVLETIHYALARQPQETAQEKTGEA